MFCLLGYSFRYRGAINQLDQYQLRLQLNGAAATSLAYSAIHRAKGFEAAGWNGVQGGVQAYGFIHGYGDFFRTTGIELVEVVKP